MQLNRPSIPGLGRSLLATFCLSLVFAAAAPAQEILLEKRTNGQDADAAPGPILTVGDPVTWTYEVTSTSGRALMNVVVTDDQGVTVTCPGTTVPPGGTIVCTASGVAAAGQYTNIGTVDAELIDGTPVSDTDPSHYFGIAAPAVTIEKSTEGFDADTAPGPSLAVGDPVSWTYEITNIGDDSLEMIEVTDDKGVTVTCPMTSLGIGESMTCTASGTVQVGQYSNVGMVTATIGVGGETTADSDPSHYFGQKLILEKRTNGVDADMAPGPAIQPGAPVTWTYEVSNPGPETVTNVSVTDDQGVTVSCPKTTLVASETMICTASGTADLGPYENIGTATADLPLGGQVSDTDRSHYTGSVLELQKSTNGQDADSAPGPTILEGDPVAWTYVVTNHGLEELTGVEVTDDQGVTVTCPGDTLAAGASMVCTANGVATVGQYENLGTAIAFGVEMEMYSATDPSHYLGEAPAPAVSASKSAAITTDGADPGVANPGDTISYTIVITNSGTGAANGVVFADGPDPNTDLVVGSVTTTQGTVTTGNTAGDTTVAVSVGAIAAGGGTVTLTFQVTVIDPLPPGVTEISNQGVVGGDDIPDTATDDPSEPGTTDPTVLAAAPAPGAAFEIPTLGGWGLLALIALLAGLAVAKLGVVR